MLLPTKRLILLAVMLFACAFNAFGYSRVSGWCEQGNKTITVGGLSSSTNTPVQRSYPRCNVTVYLTGTVTLALLYSTSTGTALSNPVAGDSNGFWSFFVADGVYDLAFAGAGIPVPFTLGAQNAIDPLFEFTNAHYVSRSKNDKLADIVSIKDYGAVCDGFTDDSAALTTINLTQPRTVIVPGGTCNLYSNVTLNSGVNLVFTGGILAPQASTTLTINGSVVAAPAAVIFGGTGVVKISGMPVLSTGWFGVGDCGANANAAYAALPPSGGTLIQYAACTYSTPIAFNTANKPVIFQGQGDATWMQYNGSSGTAITLDYGHGRLQMGHGVRDIRLTGPGHSSSTIGIMIGGSNGAQGYDIRDITLESFGVNMQFGSWTWVGKVSQSMIRDGGTNVLYPGGLTQSGENAQFDHVTFADAPPPHTNSVWIKSSETVFTDCSFDQAQLTIGDGGSFFAQVNIKGAHFENPNTSVSGSVDYNFIHMNNHAGNYLSMTDTFVEQDRLSGTPYGSFFQIDGGKVKSSGLGMFTPLHLVNVFTLSGSANIDLFSFNDLSGNTDHLLGGSTTGFVLSLPGASVGQTAGFNSIIGPGSLDGGAALDVTGNVKAKSGQLVSDIATGTQPVLVSSTTPVINMFSSPIYLSPSGTQVVNTIHSVVGEISLVAGTATVSFTGAGRFPSFYECVANDRSGVHPVGIQQLINSVIFTGTGTDLISYNCTGY